MGRNLQIVFLLAALALPLTASFLRRKRTLQREVSWLLTHPRMHGPCSTNFLLENGIIGSNGSLDLSDTELASFLKSHRCEAQQIADYLAHVDRAPRNRKHGGIIWVHLHNFAGTFMCTQAVRQNEIIGSALNCNVDDDACSTKNSAQQVHCQGRSKYSFSAIERMLLDDDLNCNNMLYGTMLRDPLAAARSTLINNRFNKKDVMDMLMKNDSSTFQAPHLQHKCLPDWDTYHHFDNFATRALSGQYEIPIGTVTREHLDIAKSRLQKMDVVMILEDLSEHLPQLEDQFGWDLSFIHSDSSQNSHEAEHLEGSFTNEEEQFLKAINKFDYELYEFGKSLAANKTAAAGKQSVDHFTD